MSDGRAKREARVISLGAGVQSTTMLLMALRGEFGDVPDFAVFADTQWEPKAVYEHLEWLEREVAPFPIHRVTAGNIRQNTIEEVRGEREGRFASIPLYVASPNGGREGMLRRQCTKEYKIEPIRRFLRKQGVKRCELWIGISMDEAQRMKPSNVQWVTHRWPLIDAGMSRHDCVTWLARNGYPEAPKSACIGCPYHADHQWRDLRDNDPDAWRDAVEFDRDVRRLPRINGAAYLHRSLKPLDEVDLSTAEERGQINMFDAECEGMCGV